MCCFTLFNCHIKSNILEWKILKNILLYYVLFWENIKKFLQLLFLFRLMLEKVNLSDTPRARLIVKLQVELVKLFGDTITPLLDVINDVPQILVTESKIIKWKRYYSMKMAGSKNLF